MSIKKNKQFTGKVSYKSYEQNEIFFDDENIDITEEIEKTLNEMKNSIKISSKEIDEAINSRKK